MSVNMIDIATLVSIIFGGFACVNVLCNCADTLRRNTTYLQARAEGFDEEFHKVIEWTAQFQRFKSSITTFRANITDVNTHLQRTGNQLFCVKFPPDSKYAVAERNVRIKKLQELQIAYDRGAGGGATYVGAGLLQEIDKLKSINSQLSHKEILND